MNDLFADNLFFGFVLSLAGYMLGLFLNKKIKALNPLLISVITVIVFLSVFKIDFKNYEKGASCLSFFMTPATVCLAVPLYKQISLLKKNSAAIAAGIFCGTVTAVMCIYVMALMFGLSSGLYVTLLPKSITTAIGMDLSEQLGGIKEITVAAIVITGILGNVAGEFILKLFRIKEPVAVGLALGTASHAIGTSKALELGEIQGAMGSLSITVAGLLTVVIAPLIAELI